jgi:hypothetical protein
MSARRKNIRWIAAAILGVAALSAGLTACGSGSSSSDTSAVVKEAGSEVTDDIKLTVINDSPGDVRISDICATTNETRCVSDVCQDNVKANCPSKTIADLGPGARIAQLGLVMLDPETKGSYVPYGGGQIWQPDKPGSGASVTMIGDPVDLFNLYDGRGNMFARASNPTIGEPWISVDPAGTFAGDITKWHLAEGQTQDTTVDGTVLFMHRDADVSRPYPEPDLKVMTLTIAR